MICFLFLSGENLCCCLSGEDMGEDKSDDDDELGDPPPLGMIGNTSLKAVGNSTLTVPEFFHSGTVFKSGYAGLADVDNDFGVLGHKIHDKLPDTRRSLFVAARDKEFLGFNLGGRE